MSETRESRRSAILQAACQEFSEKGFADAKIEQIARRVGIGKSTVYEYFPSKTELLEQTANWMICRVTTEVRQIMEGEDSFAQKARAYLLYMCRLMTRMGHGMLYMHGSKEILEVIQKCSRRFFSSIRDAATDAVRRACDKGELRTDIDPEMLAMLLLTLPSPVMSQQLQQDPSALDSILELTMHGLAVRD